MAENEDRTGRKERSKAAAKGKATAKPPAAGPRASTRPSAKSTAPDAPSVRATGKAAAKPAKRSAKAKSDEHDDDLDDEVDGDEELGEDMDYDIDADREEREGGEESDHDPDFEPEEGEKPAAAASKRKMRDRPEVVKLIARGKDKGFVTYDEVNDSLPEDLTSADELDELMATLANASISVVDAGATAGAAPAPKAPRGRSPASEERKARAFRRATTLTDRPPVDEDKLSSIAPPPFSERQPASDDSYSGKSNDPVRMYLRKMGSVSLLTREGEVEIAKRIEDGELKVFEVILKSKVGLQEILELGEKLKAGSIRVKDVVKDGDVEEGQEFDEVETTKRVVRLLDKVRRVEGHNQKIREEFDQNKKLTDKQKKTHKSQLEKNRLELLDTLREVRFAKKQIDAIVGKL
ncbi:MAG: RNA polymerase sigma factor region1.1 domain-containing protein, partial [Polyangiales bacterium]